MRGARCRAMPTAWPWRGGGRTGEWRPAGPTTRRGRWAVYGSKDKTVKVWDVETGHERRTLKGHASWVKAVALSADGRTAVSCSNDKTVKVWDVETRRFVVSFSGDADFLAVARGRA